MTHAVRCRMLVNMMGALGLALILSSPSAAQSTVARASDVGAHLDTHLMNGGGTDDTAVLQKILDRAKDGRPLHLIVDGPALVSGLNVYSNTTLEFSAGAGLYLKDNACRALIRNAHRSRGAISDEHIEIRGGFLNGNRKHQRCDALPSLYSPVFAPNRESDGTFVTGIQFMGVNDLSIHDTTLWSLLAFGALISNANHVNIHHVTVDHGGGPDASLVEFAMTDGLHFEGPLRYVTIDSIQLRTGDDGIALIDNALDQVVDGGNHPRGLGPYLAKGPITDVIVSNVILMEGCLNGIRILSTDQRTDRISISHVAGSVYASALQVSHWLHPSPGNVGSLSVNDFNVVRVPAPQVQPKVEARQAKARETGSSPSALTAEQKERARRESNGGKLPFININAHVETLKLGNILTRVSYPEPVLRIGPDAVVRLMNVDLTADDPSATGAILQLDEGGRVESMKLSLNWQGSFLRGRSPIVAKGGKIEHLDMDLVKE